MAKSAEKTKKADEPEEAPAGDDAPALEPVKKRLPGKVIILYIVAPLLVLLIGGGAGAYFLGMFDAPVEEHGSGEHAADGEHEEGKPVAVFYDLPEILVNLSTTGKKETYLKIRIALELEDEKMQAGLEPLMPRVVDNFQVFLREMRVEDLSGSAGMVRLKEELLQRINLSVQPLKVRDVLFKEMLIQ